MIPITLLKLHDNSTEASTNNDLLYLIIIAAAELPAALVCYLLVDHKEFGRKNLMAMAYGCICVMLFLGSSFLRGNYYLYWISGCKFFVKITHILTFQYTTEVYESSIRVTGVGAGSSMSRIAGLIMPFACFKMMELGDMMSPYYLFLILSLFALVMTLQLPYDTTGRVLDSLDDDKSVDPYASDENPILSE